MAKEIAHEVNTSHLAIMDASGMPQSLAIMYARESTGG
jgi:hypothetical protein